MKSRLRDLVNTYWESVELDEHTACVALSAKLYFLAQEMRDNGVYPEATNLLSAARGLFQAWQRAEGANRDWYRIGQAMVQLVEAAMDADDEDEEADNEAEKRFRAYKKYHVANMTDNYFRLRTVDDRFACVVLKNDAMYLAQEIKYRDPEAACSLYEAHKRFLSAESGEDRVDWEEVGDTMIYWIEKACF